MIGEDFVPYGSSSTISVTQSSQAFALPTLPVLGPSIRLMALRSDQVAWYIKLGDSSVTVSLTTGMKVQCGVLDSPVILPILNGETYIAIMSEGPAGSVILTSGSQSTPVGTFTGASALTKVDDTNVTLTLGGSPTNALLAATSLTLGWTGTLPLSRLDVSIAPTWTGAHTFNKGITQPLGHTFYNPNAVINRFNDRSFFGPATVNDGTTTNPSADWLGQLGYSDGIYAQAFILTENTSTPATAATPIIGLLVGTQTLNSVVGSTPRALESVAYNNTTATVTAWAQYSEARKTAATAGNTYVAEWEAITTTGATFADPYSQPAGGTYGLCLGSGGGGVVGALNATAALYITSNTTPFNAGIVFLATNYAGAGDSISTAGPSGSRSAISMPRTYEIQWYSAAATLAGRIFSDSSSNINIAASAGASIILGNATTSLAHTITSASATALAVGLTGATNPAFTVDSSTASQVAGLKVTGAATGGTVAVVATDSGSNTNLTINAKGSGTIGIGSVSTGAVTITPALTLSNALTYGGVTLTNAVTGTGKMVLDTAPTFTTRATVPLIIGGSGTTGTQLTLQSTTGNGTTDAIALVGGNNGATAFGTFTAVKLNLPQTTASTGTASGALTIAGGLGVAGAIYSGGGFHATAGNFSVADGAAFLFGGGSGTSYMGGSAAGTFVNYVTNNVERGRFTLGLTIGAPTGGDKGAGTINCAADIYKNNSAYTNPDFVLEKFYTGCIVKFADRERASGYEGLMPLKQLRDYTRSNLRLPRITDEPVGMFERGDIALEKIEEAYLYILELHERITDLETM